MEKQTAGMQPAIRPRKSLFGVSVLLAVIVLIGLGLLVHRYYVNLNRQLFEERQEHLIEFTEKTAQLIEKSNENALNQLNACVYGLSAAPVQTETALQDCLLYLRHFVGDDDTLVLLFDQKGDYIASDGAGGYWEESSFLQGTDGAVSIGVMACPHEDGEPRMIYAKRLEREIPIAESGRVLTHVAIAIRSDRFREELSVTGYAENGCTYLTNHSGRRLYQYAYNNNNTFLGGYNVIRAVETCEVLNAGRYESLSAAVQAHASDAYEFVYTDERTGEKVNWFVGVSTIDAADWVVLLLVPAAVLGEGTANLLADTAGFFAMIAAALIAVFMVVFVTLMHERSDRVLFAKQQEANRLLREAAEKAEAASRAKTEFLSHMSHDIRTPINAIMGMTGIAMKNIGREEKLRDCLKKIDGASQHLLSLVNDVLDMSRIESGKTVISHEVFSLRECLNNCASIISGQLVNRDVTLIRDFERIRAHAVVGDELHLRQVFINILGNSVKFTPDGGSITFRAWEEAEDGKTVFVFALSDTGIGMSKEFLPKLFDAFSQEDGGSRTTYKGTGLGMAITKRFVDLMGGSIEVESELNHGTTFLLKIPMPTAELPQENAAQGEDYSALKDLRILLAEDNELNAEIAEEILQEVGIDVRLAVNGREALRLFEASQPGEYAAILMDIMMPEMNGFEATRAIRQLPRADAAVVPIIALSANAYDEDIRKTREAGMNAHLSKPVNPAAVYKELLHYASGAANKPGQALTGLTVLVAEDNELNAEIMLDTLEENGVKVRLAADGKAAAEAFAASQPGELALILMDMQMPVMDGVTAARAIRQMNRADAKTIPILALTANTAEEAGKEAESAGMNGFLMKPLRIEALGKWVQAHASLQTLKGEKNDEKDNR